jgi:hypothetical protein
MTELQQEPFRDSKVVSGGGDMSLPISYVNHRNPLVQSLAEALLWS